MNICTRLIDLEIKAALGVQRVSLNLSLSSGMITGNDYNLHATINKYGIKACQCDGICSLDANIARYDRENIEMTKGLATII